MLFIRSEGELQKIVNDFGMVCDRRTQKVTVRKMVMVLKRRLKCHIKLLE